MHLSSFGLISLSGSVTKPEPGLGFADYQVAMAHYNASLMLRARVGQTSRASGKTTSATQAKQACKPELVPNARRQDAVGVALRKATFSDAAALVRKFRG